MAINRVALRLRSALLTLALALSAAGVTAALHYAGSEGSSGFSWATRSQPVAAASATPPARLGPGLSALARRTPDRPVQVIVQLRGDYTAAVNVVRQAGGRVDQRLSLINGFAATLPAAGAAELAHLADVRAVSLNAEIKGTGFAVTGTSNLASAFDASIQAPQAWTSGATGSGVGVAVIDTGVAGNLPDLQVSPSNPASRVVASAVVDPAAPNASDGYGHGTHVAGIIAGDGWNLSPSNPDYGRYLGVAPDANIVAVKADDGHGHSTVLDLIDGIQFAVDHRAQYNIRVINLSVRSTVAQSYKTDPLDAAAEQAWFKGIVVVAAAGNLGTAGDAVSYAPANDPYVITVGGVDDQGTPGTGDDAIASWSSRGVTQDGFTKPDVLAPGAHIVSTLAPGSDITSLCSSCMVDGQYFRMGGTSMAAAVVSGAVADVLSVHPDWTPAQVKGTLVSRTRPVLQAQSSTTLVNADGAAQPSSDTTSSTISQGEVALNKVLSMAGGSPAASADQNLTPNQFVDPATGNITDQTGSWALGSWGTGSWGTGSWSGGEWTPANGSYVATWAPQDSYTGAPLNPNGFTAVPPDCIQLQRGYFSTGSWSTGSWSAEQLNSALNACSSAAAQTGSWGTGSWGTGSWGTGSWGTGSWGTGSWGTGSWGTGSWSTGSWSTGSWATSFNN